MRTVVAARPRARRRLSRWLLPALLLSLVGAPALSAESYGDVSVSSLPVMAGNRTHGYVEYRFVVTNRGRVPHHVLLEGGMRSYGASGVVLRRAVDVAAGASVEVALRQPALSMWLGGVQVFIDGRRREPRLAPEGGGPAFFHSYAGPLVLASTRLPREALPAEVPAQGSPEHTAAVTAGKPLRGIQLVRAPLPVAAWSGSWLAFSSYDGVALEAAELVAAPAPVREALHRYAEAGGVLLVVGDEGPAPIFGLSPVDGEEAKLAWQRVGFGSLAHAASVAIAAAEHGAVESALERAAAPWRNGRQAAHAARSNVPVHDAPIPVRGLLLFVISFVVVVGPVNLFFLDRWRRRAWVLWTVPAISLVATAGLAAYGVLSEGVVRERSSLSVTLLDQATHRAVTWGWNGFYATFAPAEGLRFAADTEVTPTVDFGEQLRMTLGVDWTAGQQLAPGWLAARAPLHLQTRTPALRRERLLVSRRDGALAIDNGLQAPLVRVVVADGQGRLWEGADVPVGARRLLAAGGTVATPADAAAEVLAAGLPQAALRLTAEPARYLAAGSYLAVLDGDPFSEPALAGATAGRRRAIVYGRLAAGET
jgi:hypothetical protein